MKMGRIRHCVSSARTVLIGSLVYALWHPYSLPFMFILSFGVIAVLFWLEWPKLPEQRAKMIREVETGIEHRSNQDIRNNRKRFYIYLGFIVIVTTMIAINGEHFRNVKARSYAPQWWENIVDSIRKPKVPSVQADQT